MKKTITLIFFLFLACSSQKYVIINNQRVFIEIADSPSEWQHGLQYRISLPENNGMLFVFPFPRNVTFWMKDTHINLDMIFINHDKTILAIEKNVQPCIIDPCNTYSHNNVLFVLEVNAGFADKYGIKENQIVTIN